MCDIADEAEVRRDPPIAVTLPMLQGDLLNGTSHESVSPLQRMAVARH